MIDFITILPVFTAYIPGSDQTSTWGKFIKMVRVLRVLRVLRLYRIFYAQGPEQSKGAFTESTEVRRKIMMISATIMAIVFIATGLIYQLNQMDVNFAISVPNDEQLTFDSTFYFMIVTVCTVGYGDMSPKTDFARIIVGIFIILIIVLVSKQTSELNELMKFSSEYRIPYRGPPGGHILLLGNISANTLSKFLKECFHPDHNMQQEMKVVIIQEKEPSKEMLTVLTNPKYQDSLHFIVGNIFKEQVMKMASIKETKIFILCNQFSADSKKDDIYALLATKALHEFDPSSKLFVQLVDPDFLLHSWADWDVVMSTQAYKMGIIAQNAFNPGFCTFICNLIMSTSISSNIKKKFPEWVINYCNGLSQEFYLVNFNNDFSRKYIGKTFQEAVEIVYMQHGILLLGIRSLSSSDQSEVCYYDVLINPLNYVIKPQDEAIIICDDQEVANSIWQEEASITAPIVNNAILITDDQIGEWNVSQAVTTSEGQLASDHYYMWETDLRGLVKNHFIVFGQLDHLPSLLNALKHYTQQIVCFVSDKSPDERWAKIRRNFSNAFYLESSLSDVDELCKTAIEDSFHVILLTWFVQDSSIQDSGILPIVRIIEENFRKVNFTLELLDESNMKFLNYRPRKDFGNISFNIWPRYASSNIFFSSTMDYVMAQAFHMESIVEIVGKLINSNMSPNISGIEENSEINVIRLPDHYCQYNFVDIFNQLVKLSKCIIPLGTIIMHNYHYTAIIRDAQDGKNQIPVILINPAPETRLMKGDKILLLGIIKKRANQFDGELLYQEQNLLSSGNDKQVDLYTNMSLNDELLLLAKQQLFPYFSLKQRMLDEDELLNVKEPALVKRIEEEFSITQKEREQLLKMNDEIRNILNDYAGLKKKITK